MDEKRMKMVMEDRISNLPSHLIEFILMLMPLKEVVRTSILSSTWRYMWVSCPKLLINEDFYKDNFEIEPLRQRSFVNVVDSIILCHVGHVQKFELYIPNLTKDLVGFEILRDVDRWVHSVLCNNTVMEHFCIENGRDDAYVLPLYVFQCLRLKALSLFNCKIELPYRFGGFCNLKIICLGNMSFSTNTFETLLPSALVLSELILIDCDGIVHLKGDAPNLRDITFRSWDNPSVLGFFGSTPNLQDVALIGRTTTLAITKYGKAANLTDLLCGMPKLRLLKLSGSMLKVLAAGKVPKPFPTLLNHLTRLELWCFFFVDLEQISSTLWLLRCSPNLRIFFMQPCKIRKTNVNVVEFLERSKSIEPFCQLQNVEFSDANGSRDEMLFIELLLSKTPLLQTMKIEMDVADISSSSTKILEFPRASTTAELIFTTPNHG